MKTRLIAWSIVGLLSFAVAARAGPVLIGGSYAGIIYDVDPTTGAASNPRDTGLPNLSGLAWSTNGILYGLEYVPFVGPTLVTIDTHTGLYAVVGPTGNAGLSAVDIAFDPTTGVLFGASTFPGEGSGYLFKIDTNSGVASRLGDIQGTVGLAVDPRGNLFSVGNDALYNIDKHTAQVLGTIPLSPNLLGLVGATFAADGRFFVTDTLPGEIDSLYVLDQKTGVLDAVGPTGVPDGITSLTSVPEPLTGGLLGVAALWGILRTRRIVRRTDRPPGTRHT